jgi:hypothetical protein
MIDIIYKCFKQYGYSLVESIKYDDTKFFKKSDTKVASYFLVKSIDCASFETDEKEMKAALEKLENDYVGNDEENDIKSMKQLIMDSFDSTQDASQIDKNTSAIYLLKFDNIENFKKHRNLIYAIEESPNYFLRYVLPYTQRQIDGMDERLNANADKPLNEVLSDITNDSNEYYNLMDGNNAGSVYELAVRMFSKVPFLQYNFQAIAAPKSIEEDISDNIRGEELEKYHDAVVNGASSLDDLFNLEFIEDSSEIDDKLYRLLGGTQNGI